MSKQLFGHLKKVTSWSNYYQRIHHSTKQNLRCLEQLDNRSLLQVQGTDVSNFLQGLITNDMRHFDDVSVGNIYAIFLNTKGRVLFDTIIYKRLEDNCFLIECDKSLIDQLRRHLMIYKLRKKVDISFVDEIKIWSMFDVNFKLDATNDLVKSSLTKQLYSLNENHDDVVIYKDPRIHDLCHRILTKSSIKKHDIIKKLDPLISIDNNDTSSSYKEFRYKLGIGEGADDLPPGKPLPLEANCDYLHGISFHKGCYIGQELTARTHHTGIVRKRLMPLTFDQIPQIKLSYDDNIVDDNDKSIGKLRGFVGQRGLGLMRVIESVNAKTIKLTNLLVKTKKPYWWPLESRTEKINLANK